MASHGVAPSCDNEQVKNSGNIIEGVRFYKRALVHNAKYPPAWYNLGVAYAEQGNVDEVQHQLMYHFNISTYTMNNNINGT
jgi:tetratricopeptide (TPR) repeat protein